MAKKGTLSVIDCFPDDKTLHSPITWKANPSNKVTLTPSSDTFSAEVELTSAAKTGDKITVTAISSYPATPPLSSSSLITVRAKEVGVRFNLGDRLLWIDREPVGLKFNTNSQYDFNDRVYNFGNLFPVIEGTYSGLNFSDVEWEATVIGENSTADGGGEYHFRKYDGSPVKYSDHLEGYSSYTDNLIISATDLGNGKFTLKVLGQAIVSGRSIPCFVIGDVRIRCLSPVSVNGNFLCYDEFLFNVGIGVCIGHSFTPPNSNDTNGWTVLNP